MVLLRLARGHLFKCLHRLGVHFVGNLAEVQVLVLKGGHALALGGVGDDDAWAICVEIAGVQCGKDTHQVVSVDFLHCPSKGCPLFIQGFKVLYVISPTCELEAVDDVTLHQRERQHHHHRHDEEDGELEVKAISFEDGILQYEYATKDSTWSESKNEKEILKKTGKSSTSNKHSKSTMLTWLKVNGDTFKGAVNTGVDAMFDFASKGQRK